MKHIDLFSGIGGFALAVDQVFYEKEVQHTFVENDIFCQQILRKHWPEAEIHGDIRAFTDTDSEREYTGRGEVQETNGKVPERNHNAEFSNTDTFILTGGFPCQPFSQAGVRKGIGDDRYLWPEMLRVIREFRPEWVIAENVVGLLSIQDGLVFEQVCADLENEGYEVQPYNIPACAVGAPHQRQRIWIVAHKQRPRRKRGGNENSGRLGQHYREREHERRDWERHWIEVATKFCRVDDGLPDRIYGLDGYEISKSKHRKERLKACGNAIVPQVAIKIMEGIKNCA